MILPAHTDGRAANSIADVLSCAFTPTQRTGFPRSVIFGSQDWRRVAESSYQRMQQFWLCLASPGAKIGFYNPQEFHDSEERREGQPSTHTGGGKGGEASSSELEAFKLILTWLLVTACSDVDCFSHDQTSIHSSLPLMQRRTMCMMRSLCGTRCSACRSTSSQRTRDDKRGRWMLACPHSLTLCSTPLLSCLSQHVKPAWQQPSQGLALLVFLSFSGL